MRLLIAGLWVLVPPGQPNLLQSVFWNKLNEVLTKIPTRTADEKPLFDCLRDMAIKKIIDLD